MATFRVKLHDTTLPLTVDTDLTGASVKAFIRSARAEGEVPAVVPVNVTDPVVGAFDLVLAEVGSGEFDLEVLVEKGGERVRTPSVGFDRLVIGPNLDDPLAAPYVPSATLEQVIEEKFAGQADRIIPFAETAQEAAADAGVFAAATEFDANRAGESAFQAGQSAGYALGHRNAAKASADAAVAAAASIAKDVPGGVPGLDGDARVPDARMPARLSPQALASTIDAQIDAKLDGFQGAAGIRPIMCAGSSTSAGSSAGSLTVALGDALLTLTGVKPTVVRAAQGGYTSQNMLGAFPGWLATNAPSIVTLETTGNDGRIDNTITPQIQQANLRKMVSQTLQAGAQPVLMTRWRLLSADANAATNYNPPIYDSTTDAHILAANELTRELATQMKVPLVDLQNIFDGLADYLASDKVHLNAYGYSVMARAVASVITHNPIPSFGAVTLVSDEFARTDAAALGVATTGGTWTDTTTGHVGITSGAAKRQGAAGGSDRDAVARLTASSSGTLRATLKTPPASASAGAGGLLFRGVSDGDYLYVSFRYTSGALGWSVFKSTNATTAGAVWSPSTAGVTPIVPAAGDVVEVVLSGTTVTVKINGTQLCSIDYTTANVGATQVGFTFAGSNTAAAWESVSFVGIPA